MDDPPIATGPPSSGSRDGIPGTVAPASSAMENPNTAPEAVETREASPPNHTSANPVTPAASHETPNATPAPTPLGI